MRRIASIWMEMRTALGARRQCTESGAVGDAAHQLALGPSEQLIVETEKTSQFVHCPLLEQPLDGVELPLRGGVDEQRWRAAHTRRNPLLPILLYKVQDCGNMLAMPSEPTSALGSEGAIALASSQDHHLGLKTDKATHLKHTPVGSACCCCGWKPGEVLGGPLLHSALPEKNQASYSTLVPKRIQGAAGI